MYDLQIYTFIIKNNEEKAQKVRRKGNFFIFQRNFTLRYKKNGTRISCF